MKGNHVAEDALLAAKRGESLRSVDTNVATTPKCIDKIIQKNAANDIKHTARIIEKNSMNDVKCGIRTIEAVT